MDIFDMITLKNRASLVDIPNQTYITEKAKTVDVNASLALKANQSALDTEKSRIDTLVQTSSGSFYEECTSGDTGALLVVSSGATTGQINLASVTPVATGYTPAVSDYVRLVYGVASGSSELIDARGTETILKNRIDKVESGERIFKKTNYADTFNSANRAGNWVPAKGTTGLTYTDSANYYKIETDATYNTGNGNPTISLDSSQRIPFDTNKTFKLDVTSSGVYPRLRYRLYKADGTQISDNMTPSGVINGTISITTTDTNVANICIYNLLFGAAISSYVTFSNFAVYSNSDKNLADKISDINLSISTIKSNVKPNIYNLPSSATVTTGSYAVENYKKKNNNTSVKWSISNGTTGSITFSGLTIPCITTDTVGLWVYLSKNINDWYSGTDGVMKVTFYNDSTSYVSDSLYTGYKFHNGWNYISFTPNLNGITSVKVEFTLVHADYVLYFDSVELNYKKKPKIMLGFDNCGNNLYDVVYPLLDSYGFRGTFALGSGAYPGDGVVITMAKFKELMAKNWDYSMYSGTGTTPTDLQSWITFLQNYLNTLASVGIFNPIAYFCPNNQSDVVRLAAQKAVGFRMNRCEPDSNTNLIDYFDHDTFETTCMGITTDSAPSITAIDAAIAQGKSLNIFTHQILTTGDSLNATQSVYTTMLDYLKTKVDAGAVDVITYREFYQLYEPSDYENYINQRRVKEYQYILSKLP